MPRQYWSPFDIKGFDTMTNINTKITGLHPKVATALSQTLTEAKARGLKIKLYSGLRDAEDQDKKYALGRTVKNPDGACDKKPLGVTITDAPGWLSWHNYGLAVDLCYVNDIGNPIWNRTRQQWDELANVGKIFGFEWGIVLKSGEIDYPHFQMRGMIPSIREAKRILFESGIDVLWSMV